MLDGRQWQAAEIHMMLDGRQWQVAGIHMTDSRYIYIWQIHMAENLRCMAGNGRVHIGTMKHSML